MNFPNNQICSLKHKEGIFLARKIKNLIVKLYEAQGLRRLGIFVSISQKVEYAHVLDSKCTNFSSLSVDVSRAVNHCFWQQHEAHGIYYTPVDKSRGKFLALFVIAMHTAHSVCASFFWTLHCSGNIRSFAELYRLSVWNVVVSKP